MKLVPISIREAGKFVLHYHRHHRPPQGALFALGCEVDGQLVGVAIVGRPVGRGLQDGRTVEVVRVLPARSWGEEYQESSGKGRVDKSTPAARVRWESAA